jgi:predicted DNA binding CopG/RHH family protein
LQRRTQSPPPSRIPPDEGTSIDGLSLEPDEFFAQHARREKALRMREMTRTKRTTPIAIRLDQFTLTRLKALAAARNTGYQTLLKEFLVERLYEEEKREGII